MKEIKSKLGFGWINDSTERSRRTAESYQSIWRAHWNPARRKSTTEGRGDSARMDKELATDEDLSTRLETSRYVKGPSVIETETEVKMLSKSLEEGANLDAMLTSLTMEELTLFLCQSYFFHGLYMVVLKIFEKIQLFLCQAYFFHGLYMVVLKIQEKALKPGLLFPTIFSKIPGCFEDSRKGTEARIAISYNIQ